MTPDQVEEGLLAYLESCPGLAIDTICNHLGLPFEEGRRALEALERDAKAYGYRTGMGFRLWFPARSLTDRKPGDLPPDLEERLEELAARLKPDKAKVMKRALELFNASLDQPSK